MLIDEVTRRFPNARIILIFGITEASAALFGKHPEGRPKPRHSLGWPLPGNELRLVGGDSPDFGVLEVKNPGLMSGYVKDPEQTARRMKDGWYHSGDILRRDAEGWYYFVGRSDDMFVSSGHNIYPQDVEIMLERHDDIEQACVIPVPDEIKHTLPVAFVFKRKGDSVTRTEVRVEDGDQRFAIVTAGVEEGDQILLVNPGVTLDTAPASASPQAAPPVPPKTDRDAGRGKP